MAHISVVVVRQTEVMADETVSVVDHVAEAEVMADETVPMVVLVPGTNQASKIQVVKDNMIKILKQKVKVVRIQNGFVFIFYCCIFLLPSDWFNLKQSIMQVT